MQFKADSKRFVVMKFNHEYAFIGLFDIAVSDVNHAEDDNE